MLQHIYAIILFVFGWLVFWIEDPNIFWSFFKALFGVYGQTGTSTFWELTAWEYWPKFIICAIASTPIVPWLRAKIYAALEGKSYNPDTFWNKDLPARKNLSTEALCDVEVHPKSTKAAIVYQIMSICIDLFLIALLTLCIFSIVSGSFNPFIYFRF